MTSQPKYLGSLVEYLDQGRFRAGLVVREQDRHVALLDATGREKLIGRDLVLVRYSDRKADASNLADVLAELEHERAELSSELDLNLLWEVVHEQGRTFSADKLADLFFGRRSAAAEHQSRCRREERPALRSLDERRVACHFAERLLDA